MLFDAYFWKQYTPILVAFVPFVIIFMVGLLTKNIPNRTVHKWLPQNKGFQQLDQFFQKVGTGRGGPLLTEFINGLVHGYFFFCAAKAIPMLNQWQWEFAVATFLYWFCFGIHRSSKYVPR